MRFKILMVLLCFAFVGLSAAPTDVGFTDSPIADVGFDIPDFMDVIYAPVFDVTQTTEVSTEVVALVTQNETADSQNLSTLARHYYNYADGKEPPNIVEQRTERRTDYDYKQLSSLTYTKLHFIASDADSQFTDIPMVVPLS